MYLPISITSINTRVSNADKYVPAVNAKCGPMRILII